MFWHPSSNILFATTVDSELWMWKIPSGESKIYAGEMLFTTMNYSKLVHK